MTTKKDFSEEEWTRIVRAPFVAGLAVALADPGGPIEVAKESMALIRSATNPSSRERLVAEVALDIEAEVQQKRNPLKGYRPTSPGTAPAGDQVLVELREVRAIVAGGRPLTRRLLSVNGWSIQRRPPPTPRKREASWGSVRSK